MTKTAEKTADPALPLEGGVIEQQAASSKRVKKPATQVAVRAENAPAASVAPQSDTVAMMQLMERVAANPSIDVAKMQIVMDMQERLIAHRAKMAFDAALSEMQGEMPTINQRGRIEIRAKDAKGERTGAVQQSTKFAKWEDIADGIRPILKKFGFALRFRTGLTDAGLVRVVGILSGHGHREESEFVLQHDSTGSKNAVQAIGSSTSYGKRYAACALLNISSRGEDDDAHTGGGKIVDDGFPGDKPNVPKINQKQIDALIDQCDAVGCPRPRFLSHINVVKFEDIPAADFDAHMTLIGTFQRAK